MNSPIILDTTLRDGEQSPGLYFTQDEKITIAQKLDELGVSIIEAGIPGMGKEEKELFRKLIPLHLQAEILAWNRLTLEDVKASLDCGVSHIHVSVPTSSLLLSQKMKKDRSWVLKEMEKVIGFALREGLIVSFGAEDASRTDLAFLSTVFKHARDLGAIRVRYADTLGILSPMQTSKVIYHLTPDLGIPLDFHTHNDFGMATANSLCAWKSGAKIISCSLLGLGERAGNTALEEFIGAVHFLDKPFSALDFCSLREVCSMVAQFTDRPLSPHKPLYGKDIFNHESGIHVDGLLKNSETYELFPPEKIGGKRSIVVGKHSGRAALKYLAMQQGVTLHDIQAQEFLKMIHGLMATQKGVNTQSLFNSFLRTLVNNTSKPTEENSL